MHCKVLVTFIIYHFSSFVSCWEILWPFYILPLIYDILWLVAETTWNTYTVPSLPLTWLLLCVSQVLPEFHWAVSYVIKRSARTEEQYERTVALLFSAVARRVGSFSAKPPEVIHYYGQSLCDLGKNDCAQLLEITWMFFFHISRNLPGISIYDTAMYFKLLYY